MSTHQMHRMLGISYKSTWFMTHRFLQGSWIPIKFKLPRSERFVTRPVGRAPKFLVSFAFFIVVSVVIIVVSPAIRDDIGVRIRRHCVATAVVLTASGVDPDTTWTDAKT